MFFGYEHLIGGFCGGVASTICCHPFDLLRVRFSGKFIFNLIFLLFVKNYKSAYQYFFYSLLMNIATFYLYIYLYFSKRR